jgi:hypothetical protein
MDIPAAILFGQLETRSSIGVLRHQAHEAVLRDNQIEILELHVMSSANDPADGSSASLNLRCEILMQKSGMDIEIYKNLRSTLRRASMRLST